eukprot:6208119-Pleurochrysis_carterae.AAC.3
MSWLHSPGSGTRSRESPNVNAGCDSKCEDICAVHMHTKGSSGAYAEHAFTPAPYRPAPRSGVMRRHISDLGRTFHYESLRVGSEGYCRAARSCGPGECFQPGRAGPRELVSTGRVAEYLKPVGDLVGRLATRFEDGVSSKRQEGLLVSCGNGVPLAPEDLLAKVVLSPSERRRRSCTTSVAIQTDVKGAVGASLPVDLDISLGAVLRSTPRASTESAAYSAAAQARQHSRKVVASSGSRRAHDVTATRDAPLLYVSLVRRTAM